MLHLSTGNDIIVAQACAPLSPPPWHRTLTFTLLRIICFVFIPIRPLSHRLLVLKICSHRGVRHRYHHRIQDDYAIHSAHHRASQLDQSQSYCDDNEVIRCGMDLKNEYLNTPIIVCNLDWVLSMCILFDRSLSPERILRWSSNNQPI